MTRSKVTAAPVLQDWNEVDAALREIGERAAECAELQRELDAQIASAKGRFEAQMVPVSQRLKRLEKDVQEYAEVHKAELEEKEGRRSKVLNWGTVSFRRSTVLSTIKGWTAKAVVDALRASKALKFLRVKREVEKDVVKRALAAGDLSEAKLATWGMTIEERDTFGYELDRRPMEDRAA